MANYVCCGTTCCRRVTDEERTQELHSEITKAVLEHNYIFQTSNMKKPLLAVDQQKPLMIVDESNSNNNSLLRTSYHNAKRDFINDLPPHGKHISTDNSNSSNVIQIKCKTGTGKIKRNGRSQSGYSNTNGNNNGFGSGNCIGSGMCISLSKNRECIAHEKSMSPYMKYSKQFTLTNNNHNYNSSHLQTFNNIFPYEEKDMKIRIAEEKIVKRSNLSEYNKNTLYGKPSNTYTSERLNLFQSSSNHNESNQSKRTFKKFNESYKARNIDLYSCEYCREIYKSMIIHHEELKPIRCPQCNNILNEKSYQFYYRIYNTLSPEKQASKGGNLDHGSLGDNWTKWIRVKTEQKMESMAYDILSGRAVLTQSNSNDAKLKQMIASTRDRLNKSSQRYYK